MKINKFQIDFIREKPMRVLPNRILRLELTILGLTLLVSFFKTNFHLRKHHLIIQVFCFYFYLAR
jgi:hypothetical protein